MRHQLSIPRALLLLLCALAFPLFGDAAKFRAASSAEPVVGRYLVTLATEAGGDDGATIAALARAYGGRLEPFAEEGVRGFIISMRPARARALSADPRVSVVDEQSAAEVRAEPAPVRAAAPSAPEPPRVISSPARTTAPIGAQWASEPTLWRSDAYSYDGAGNIIAIGNDSYRYDGAGRLKYATARTPAATDNQQDFTYDRWGNLTLVTTTTGQTASKRAFAVDPDTNQLDGNCADPQVTCTKRTYDAAGNETGDPTGMSGSSFTWDVSGVLTEIHGLRHERYLYDANDERIVTIRYAGAFESERFYTLRGSDNKVARELSHFKSSDQWRLVKDYVYRGGSLMASFSGAETTPSRHYHLDHLGTPRLVTDAAGYKVATQTFWPFGGIAPGSDNDPTTRLKFTGHERDANANWPENDLDYMHARYYSAATGRFLSVDPAGPRPGDPRTWNRYTYAANNPIRNVDSDGRDWYAVLFTGYHRRSGMLTRLQHEAIVWIDPVNGYGTTYEHPLGHPEYVGPYRGSWAVTDKLMPARFRNLGPTFDPAARRATQFVGADEYYARGRLQCTNYCAYLIGDVVAGPMTDFLMNLPPSPDLADRKNDDRYVEGEMINGYMWPKDIAAAVRHGTAYMEVTARSTSRVSYPDLHWYARPIPDDGGTALYCLNGACH